MKKGRESPIVAEESPLNAEAPLRSLRSPVTPVSSFFIRSHFATPRVRLSKWSLKVEGDVEKGRDFGYAELLAMPARTVTATIECAGNGRKGFRTAAEGELRWGYGAVGTARWTGVPLRAILEGCGLKAGATEVVAFGADSGRVQGASESISFSRSLPLNKALEEDTIVALRMNGRRLSAEHGYPARLLVPGWYGMASVKWLNSIEVISGDAYRAFFNGVKYVYVEEKHGKETTTPVSELRVKSLVTNPSEGDRLEAGAIVRVTGRAWSGSGRISRVEVEVGDGWKRAELGPRPEGRFEWVEWSTEWTPKKRGKTVVSARATDEKGNVQPLEPWDNKLQYGYNAVARVSVTVV